MRRLLHLSVFIFLLNNLAAQENIKSKTAMHLASLNVYPPVSEVRWFLEKKVERMVYYRDSTTIHVYMNKKGTVTKVARFYSDVSELPVFVVAKLAELYPGYIPFSIIEEHDITGVHYLVNIRKGNRWLQLHGDIYGRFTILERHRFPRDLVPPDQATALP